MSYGPSIGLVPRDSKWMKHLYTLLTPLAHGIGAEKLSGALNIELFIPLLYFRSPASPGRELLPATGTLSFGAATQDTS